MNSVEQRLELIGQPEEKEESVTEDERGQILTLIEQLTAPELSAEARLNIAAQIRRVLLWGTRSFSLKIPFIETNRSLPLDHPPPESIHPVAV